MANEQHLKILKQGVTAWNDWRENQRSVGTHLRTPDLRGAYLREINLSNANLSYADLTNADLIRTTFSQADLHGAHFNGANLNMADLSFANLMDADFTRASLARAYLKGASLTFANFTFANLSGATLINADLDGADLRGADLSGAELRRANLNSAFLDNSEFKSVEVEGTLFADVDLRYVKDLDKVRHSGPSEVSLNTIAKSVGGIPRSFLQGCGLKDWEIESTHLYRAGLSPGQITEITYKVIELLADPLIQFHSCFISYSDLDREFAQQLYRDLQDRGVRCWFAPIHMRIGDRIRTRLDESIQLHDKLLLVLSKASIESRWVEQEVETALEKEKTLGKDVLFPVRLDDTVMGSATGWPALIKRTRHIGNFSQWEDANEYRKSFGRLLDDLMDKNERDL